MVPAMVGVETLVEQSELIIEHSLENRFESSSVDVDNFC
jgi:hypothetical protein